jgi:exosortase/archaeosortase family protein
MASKQIVQFILKHKGLHGGAIFLSLLLGSCWLLSRSHVMAFLELNFTAGIATQAACLLKLLGINVIATGISVTGHGFSVDIKYGCNAIYEILIYTAAMVSYPLRMKKKITGIIIGVVFIYILNLFRVIVLFWAGMHFPDVFKALHEHIGQSIFIFFLVFLWIFWVTRINKSANSQ